MSSLTARILTAVLVSCAACTVFPGCAPAFNGAWNGSGETGEARFFEFSLDLEKGSPKAVFTWTGGQAASVAVCGLTEQDGHVQFQMDPASGAADCTGMKNPLTFVGDFGRDVVTGKVLERADNGGERLVGLFRAFRVRK